MLRIFLVTRDYYNEKEYLLKLPIPKMEFPPWKLNILANKIVIYTIATFGWRNGNTPPPKVVGLQEKIKSPQHLNVLYLQS